MVTVHHAHNCKTFYAQQMNSIAEQFFTDYCRADLEASFFKTILHNVGIK
jgi:hypothetical protein